MYVYEQDKQIEWIPWIFSRQMLLEKIKGAGLRIRLELTKIQPSWKNLTRPLKKNPDPILMKNMDPTYLP